MRKIFFILSFLLSMLTTPALAQPTIDTLNVQGFMKKADGTAVTNGTYNVAFGVMQNGTIIWAKQYSVTINNGLMSQALAGAGGNLSGLPAGTGMNADYTGTNLYAALLVGAGNGPLTVRVYGVSTIDASNPQFDLPISAVPTSYVAETSKGVVAGSVGLAGIAAAAKTNSSAGAGDAGKLVLLDAGGLIAVNMLPNIPASQINSGQVGVANGGTGSTDGSITGSAALTLKGAAGTSTTVGDNSGAASLVLRSGTGGISESVSGTSGNISMTAGTSSGAIVLTPGTASGAVTIGSSASSGNSTLGNGGGASSTTILSGTTGILLAPSGIGLVRVTNGNGLNLVNGAGSITINAPVNPTSYNFILPSTAGSNGQVLSTNGSGTLSWVNGGGTVTSVSGGTGTTGGTITSAGTINVNVGTGANQIPALNFLGQMPAVDGSLMTFINASSLQAIPLSAAAPVANQVLRYNGSAWVNSPDLTTIVANSPILGGGTGAAVTLSLDVGTGANQVVQLNGSSQIPALDGSLLTNISASKIQGNLVATNAPSNNDILQWNGSRWQPSSVNPAGITIQPSASAPLALLSGATAGAITLGGTASTGLVTVGNTGSGVTTLQSGTGGTVVTSSGTTPLAVKLTATGAGGGVTIQPNATGTLSLLSGTTSGAVTLGGTASTGLVTVGNTGSGVTTIQSGTGGSVVTSTGTTPLAVKLTATGAGGGITLTPNATGTLTLLSGSTSGAVTLGGTASTGNTVIGNTGAASITTIQSGSTGKIKLQASGSTGVAFSAMGTCTTASFAASAGTNAQACANLPAGAAVSCSPTVSQGSITWSAWPSAAGTVTIIVSNAGATSTWVCMWLLP